MMRNCSFFPSQQIETWTRFKNGKANRDTAMRASFSKATQKNHEWKEVSKCQTFSSLFIILIFYLQYLDEMSSFLGNACQSRI